MVIPLPVAEDTVAHVLLDTITQVTVLLFASVLDVNVGLLPPALLLLISH